MKKMLGLAGILWFGIWVCLSPQFLIAEETPQALVEDEWEGAEFSYGTVQSTSVDQIVVSEYDYDTDQEVDVTYKVTPDTAFENVASLSEVTVGDSVDIDYVAENGEKSAVAITVEKPFGEDEDTAIDLGIEEESS